MSFFKLLLSFAPWISFLIIASGHSMFRLKLGIVVAALLVVATGIAKLNRGVILWATAGFFLYALVAVVWKTHLWAIEHMGLLANGTLAAGTWFTVAIRKPFTLEYAREHTSPSVWNSPLFIRTNYILTCVWGVAFLGSVLNAWVQMSHPDAPRWIFNVAQYSCMLAAMLITTWYPKHVARTAHRS